MPGCSMRSPPRAPPIPDASSVVSGLPRGRARGSSWCSTTSIVPASHCAWMPSPNSLGTSPRARRSRSPLEPCPTSACPCCVRTDASSRSASRTWPWTRPPPAICSGAPASTRPRKRHRSSPRRPKAGPVGLYLAGLSRQQQRRSGLSHRSASPARTGTSSTTSAQRCWGRLSRQRQRFLTRTSVLERLSAPVRRGPRAVGIGSGARVHRARKPSPRARSIANANGTATTCCSVTSCSPSCSAANRRSSRSCIGVRRTGTSRWV